VTDATTWLLSARQNMTVAGNLPISLYPNSTRLAYRVREFLVSQLTGSNDSLVIGYKLACTFAPLVKMLGAYGSFHGGMTKHASSRQGIHAENAGD